MNNTWQYRGKNGELVMFAITESRARKYAELYGGTAEPMPEPPTPEMDKIGPFAPYYSDK